MSEALVAIERLALTIAREAGKDDIKLDQKLEALKTLAPYYAALKKGERKEPEDDEGSLEHLADTINQAEGVPNGRRVQVGRSPRG